MSWAESEQEEILHSSNPGEFLASVREAQGLSQEYVAGKLYLRTQVVQLLEADAYDDLPQPVFIQGYFRAYAKLLGVDASGLLERFNELRGPEKKVERILRQRDKESAFRSAHLAWIVGGLALLLLACIYFFGHHQSRAPQLASAKTSAPHSTSLTDLNQMDLGLSLQTGSKATNLESKGA